MYIIIYRVSSLLISSPYHLHIISLFADSDDLDILFHLTHIISACELEGGRNEEQIQQILKLCFVNNVRVWKCFKEFDRRAPCSKFEACTS